MSKSIVGVPVEGQQITIGLPKLEREAVIDIAYNSYVDSKICRRFPIIAMGANHVDNIRRTVVGHWLRLENVNLIRRKRSDRSGSLCL